MRRSGEFWRYQMGYIWWKKLGGCISEKWYWKACLIEDQYYLNISLSPINQRFPNAELIGLYPASIIKPCNCLVHIRIFLPSKISVLTASVVSRLKDISNNYLLQLLPLHHEIIAQYIYFSHISQLRISLCLDYAVLSNRDIVTFPSSF